MDILSFAQRLAVCNLKMQKLKITEHGGIERENHVWHLSIMSATNSHDHEIFYFFEYKQLLYAFRY